MSVAPLGVVVVSFNTAALLDACLRSVHAALVETGWLADAEVVVVDNHSADESVAFVRRHHPWVRLVASDVNLGFTAANNVALAPWASGAAPCPARVLLLNPDAELLPGALAALAAVLDAEPRTAVVGPSLRYADGRFQHGAFRFPGLVQTGLDLWPVARLADSRLNGRYPRRRYDRGRPFDVDAVLGACMLVRADALQAVGPLDTGYFMYCEELDWCQRFRAAGWRVRCVPAAGVIPHGGASTSRFQSTTFVHLWRSRLRYFDAHAGGVRARLLRALVRIGFARHDRADDRAVRRGRRAAATAAARRDARRAVFAPAPPP